ncbi:hypothetical protein KM043_008108 [Ampulex compressa]|nr:hypothetical protein KM043_008108 [Ampulex compressa]
MTGSVEGFDEPRGPPERNASLKDSDSPHKGKGTRAWPMAPWPPGKKFPPTRAHTGTNRKWISLGTLLVPRSGGRKHLPVYSGLAVTRQPSSSRLVA